LLPFLVVVRIGLFFFLDRDLEGVLDLSRGCCFFLLMLLPFFFLLILTGVTLRSARRFFANLEGGVRDLDLDQDRDFGLQRMFGLLLRVLGEGDLDLFIRLERDLDRPSSGDLERLFFKDFLGGERELFIMGDDHDDSLLGDLESFLGDLESLLGDLENLLGDNLETILGDLEFLLGDLEFLVGDLERSFREAFLRFITLRTSYLGSSCLRFCTNDDGLGDDLLRSLSSSLTSLLLDIESLALRSLRCSLRFLNLRFFAPPPPSSAEESLLSAGAAASLTRPFASETSLGPFLDWISPSSRSLRV
jgi:hypothetical protein